MQNGYRHETGNYAPETAVATGAVDPLVDEYEAATAVPTVDEHTLDDTAKRSQNDPSTDRTVAYSGDDVAEPTSDAKSSGEDFETRNADDDTRAGAGVSTDDAEVNKLAEEVRPEEPQAPKRTRKARSEG